jgi:hypothetical protein
MLNRIFPKQFDSHYRGHPLAIWLFGGAVLMELAMGVNSIVNTRTVATMADGIPLDQYGAGGGDAVIALFAIAGLFRVTIAILGLVALIRYRTMIPLMFTVLLLIQLGSKALLAIHPVVKSGVPTAHLGAAFVFALIGMLCVGFVLSLIDRRTQAERIGQ